MGKVSVNVLVIYLYSTLNSSWSQLVPAFSEEEFDWCCLKCDGPHVMCPEELERRNISKPEGCSSLKTNQTVVGIFDEATLVHLINQRRSKLAKNAEISNMQHLRATYKLTSFAEHLAEYCNSIPSVCVDTDDYEVKILTFNVTGHHKNITMDMVVDYWMRGRVPYLKNYHDQLYRNYSSINETDDFTLLMWGATGEIGCAEAYYYNTTALDGNTTDSSPSTDNNTISGGTTPSVNTTSSYNTNSSGNSTSLEETSSDVTLSYQITCLLGPGGNQKGAPVWERGEPCSNCSTPEQSKQSYCKDWLCFPLFPIWPHDTERLASCKSKLLRLPPADEAGDYERGVERPYAKGVTVLLKPRYICDPISAADNPTSLRWFVLVASALSSKTTFAMGTH